MLGRVFSREEGYEGANRVVLLEHGLWQNRFGGRNDVLDQRIYLDGNAHTVIGVMPPNFSFPYGEVQLWTPTALDSEAFSWDYRNFQPVGRLHKGVERGAAQQAMQTRYRTIETDRTGSAPDYGVAVVPLRRALLFLYDTIQAALVLILCANAFVLLIICANLANLMIGRAIGRTREIAIRAVLGAGRRQLMKQLLSEGLLLALAGSSLGLGLAWWQVRSLDTLLPEALFRSAPIAIDSRVLAFALTLSVITTLAFALFPALQSSKVDLSSALKEATSTSTANRRSHRARNLMVVVQISSAFVLLTGTTLMLRSVAGMRGQSLGFEPENVLTIGIHLAQNRYPERRDLTAFQSEVEARLEAIPGVRAAAFVEPLPMNFATASVGFTIEGRVPQSANERLQSRSHFIGANYFHTMQMPLLRGRSFSAVDNLNAPLVAVVNESFARLYWSDETALGRWILRTSGAPATVVGIVADSKSFFLNEENVPILYLSQRQSPTRTAFLTVRTEPDPHSVFPLIRDAIWSVQPDLPLAEVRSMVEVIDGSMLPWQAASGGLLGLAVLALGLACLGIYGVVSHAVASRTSEIGIRRALGARFGDVLRLIARRGGVLVVIGMVVGLALSIALNQLLSSLLFGVGALDPMSYLIVLGALTAAAAIAIAEPALRAARVDPIEALRYE